MKLKELIKLAEDYEKATFNKIHVMLPSKDIAELVHIGASAYGGIRHLKGYRTILSFYPDQFHNFIDYLIDNAKSKFVEPEEKFLLIENINYMLRQFPNA